MLGDLSLESGLAASLRELAHFQGEDGYRIFEKGPPAAFRESAPTALDAHVWIIERTLRDREEHTEVEAAMRSLGTGPTTEERR